MKRILVGFLAALGLLTLVITIAGAAGLAWYARVGRGPALPDRILLTLDLRDDLPEVPPAEGLASLGLQHRLTVSDLVLALDAAAADPRVKGLLARVDGTQHGFAVTQEVRQAVARFRAAGRFAIAHADTFGELGSGSEGYYLATSFERIDLQPVGLVGLTGVAAETPFIGKLLNDLGIELEVERREQYKTALETFSEPAITPPNREMLDAIVGDYAGQLASGIADGRKLDGATVAQLIDGGPYTAREAQGAGLVDAIRHYDESLEAARAQAGAGVAAVSVETYWRAQPAAASGATRVAFIRASGLIYRGGSSTGLLGRGIAADGLAGAIAEAVADDGIRGILLRIDSGGGSAVGSETVARQLRRAVAAGKPVLVSMGNTAGSGAYWIAVEGSELVAEPGTLTGSIGVVAAKPVLAALWQKLGVSWAEIAHGANSTMWSMNEPYGPAAQARVEAMLDDVYGAFKDQVARGRKLGPAQVEELAKGRVWTGSEAVERGLVDRLGGLHEALAELRVRLSLPADAALALEALPKPVSPLMRIAHLFDQGAGGLDMVSRLGGALASIGVGPGPLPGGVPALTIR